MVSSIGTSSSPCWSDAARTRSLPTSTLAAASDSLTIFCSSEAASGAVGPRSRRPDSTSRRALTAASSSTSRGCCAIRSRRRSSVASRTGTVASAARERVRIGSTRNRYPPTNRAAAAPIPITTRSRGLTVGISALGALRRALPGRPNAELLLIVGLRDRRGELDPLEPVGRLEERDQGARRIRLPGELDPLPIGGEGLEPGPRRQRLGQVAQDRKGLDPPVPG